MHKANMIIHLYEVEYAIIVSKLIYYMVDSFQDGKYIAYNKRICIYDRKMTRNYKVDEMSYEYVNI